MLKRLDRYLLTQLQHNRLTPFTRLLYALRRSWLRWHVTPSGRVARISRYGQAIRKARPTVFYRLGEDEGLKHGRNVRTDVTLDEGVRAARAWRDVGARDRV